MHLIGRTNMKGKHFIIEIPLYRQEVQIFYRCSYPYIRKKVSERLFRDLFDALEDSDAITVSDPISGEYVVCFHEPNPEPTHGVIAHEIFHVSTDICDDLGIKLTVDNQEPIAYVMTYVLDALYAALEGKLEGTEFKVEVFDDEE